MITSVYQTAQSRLDGFRAGADAYLLDPIEPDRLLDAIGRYLDPSRQGADIEPPTLITDVEGMIVSANAAAARLLNLSPRGLRDRSILAFFAPGRERIVAQMTHAVTARVVQTVTDRKRGEQ